METSSRVFTFLFLTFLLSAVVAPTASLAVLLSIGKQCQSNADCRSGQCEDSTMLGGNGKKIAYCVCGELDLENVPTPFFDSDAKSCAVEYDGDASKRKDWICKDGANTTWDLNYCVKKATLASDPKGAVRFPIPSQNLDDKFFSSLVDIALDPTAYMQASELNTIIKQPQLEIRIPGLTFTDPSNIVAGKDIKGEYLYFPYLGEYITQVYQYAIVLAGILAMIVIILSGIQWIVSGGSSEIAGAAKKRIGGGIIGLLIAVGSYTLLYTINPELVSFRGLQVQFVENKPFVYEDGGDTDIIVPEAQATQQEAELQAYEFYCPKTGGTAEIPKIIDSMKNHVAYRWGGKLGTKAPYPEVRFAQYGSYCPAGNLCLDCSGFVNYVYRCAGIDRFKGGTKSIFSNTTPQPVKGHIDFEKNTVDGKKLQAGDLLGWVESDNDGKAGHVIMYVGNGMIAESKGGEKGRQPGANPTIRPFTLFTKYFPHDQFRINRVAD